MVDFPKPSLNSSQDQPQVDPILALKSCRSCNATLPTSHFGTMKNSPDGYRHICKACRSEINHIDWTTKYGRNKPLPEDQPIRNVAKQNSHVVDMALTIKSLECRAFSLVSKADYKVFFGKSGNLGMDCICVFSLDGQMLREMAYSGSVSTVKDEILSFCKALNLRLELTEADAIAAKTTIYYL